jgi:predicted nucleic acid-binding protein
MPRKTTGNTTTRSKKNETAVQPVQVASEVPAEVSKKSKAVSVKIPAASANLEEKIRIRAYELYLQRRATAGDANGNPYQDWLVAEREVLSRHDGHTV